jgi:hypothetical protein
VKTAFDYRIISITFLEAGCHTPCLFITQKIYFYEIRTSMGISQIDEFVELLDNGKGNPAEIHRGPRFVLALPFVLHKYPLAFFVLDTIPIDRRAFRGADRFLAERTGVGEGCYGLL